MQDCYLKQIGDRIRLDSEKILHQAIVLSDWGWIIIRAWRIQALCLGRSSNGEKGQECAAGREEFHHQCGYGLPTEEPSERKLGLRP